MPVNCMPVMKDTAAPVGPRLNPGNTQGSRAEELDPPVLECKLVLPLRKVYGQAIPLT